MKRVIDGVAYNTDTATMIARNVYDQSNGGGTQLSEILYQTKGGAFFLHQHQSIRFKHPEDGWRVSEHDEFLPMPREMAEAWAMDDTELLSDVFGKVPEATAPDSAGSVGVVSIRLPASLKSRIEAAAKAKRLSVNSYAMRCFERCLGSAEA